MNLVLVLLAFAGIGVADLPEMVKTKRWRDLTIYCVLFLLVLTLGVLIAMGVKIPSPIKAIQAFYRDVLHLSFKMP
ncbi:conserved hypothetical protein [uncultured Eubacteriales bacterium]|uniref:Uncharacterized protein n=1 Tax=uncultured Eubacteriales bacterium TaxID=172733 RepID=A0A212KBM4_9FIRM|nr:conserved hypothetical protein [uncultured Eubacteriales bacterium]